jgi:hypothetical protein
MRKLIRSTTMFMQALKHHARLIYVGGALLLLLGAMACKKIQMTEMTGTWIMNDSSRQVLPTELQKSVPKIILSPDGTFSTVDLPGFFYFPGQRALRLESGSGNWKLMSSEGKQQIQLTFRTIADWNEKDLPYGGQLDLSRGWSRIELFYFMGDADEGKEIDFTKH